MPKTLLSAEKVNRFPVEHKEQLSTRTEQFSSTAGAISSRWISAIRRVPEARYRLFCFPFAGGSATAFHHWPDYFRSTVEVCAIHLPGRGNRLCERPLTRLGVVVEEVSVALLSRWAEKPFALFGHSMGALLAFETARLLEARGCQAPSHLFVSGCQAPGFPGTQTARHQLPDKELIEYLRELGGTPGEVFDNEELLDCVLPCVRADLELIETYRYSEAPALRSPITALGGIDDPEVSPEGLDAWRQESSDSFSLKMFSRGHFFIRGVEAAISEIIIKALVEGRHS
jgi:medium-chain acyl-[acyl-carrier-protein] hydrolase